MNQNQDNQACVGIMLEQPKSCMTLKNHKRLTDLAYRVKDFIDGNGGLNYE